MQYQRKSREKLGTAVAELNIAVVEQGRPVHWQQGRPVHWQQDEGVLYSSRGKYTTGWYIPFGTLATVTDAG